MRSRSCATTGSFCANPWGAASSEPAEIMLTIDEFRSNFMRYNEVPG
jgi:hypothetical protein